MVSSVDLVKATNYTKLQKILSLKPLLVVPSILLGLHKNLVTCSPGVSILKASWVFATMKTDPSPIK
jgi:hypothetical protein